MLEQVTPLIVTLNEAPNLRRTRAQLARARDSLAAVKANV
jgi:hypothetical protein